VFAINFHLTTKKQHSGQFKTSDLFKEEKKWKKSCHELGKKEKCMKKEYYILSF
jgi:hypothetical protein